MRAPSRPLNLDEMADRSLDDADFLHQRLARGLHPVRLAHVPEQKLHEQNSAKPKGA